MRNSPVVVAEVTMTVGVLEDALIAAEGEEEGEAIRGAVDTVAGGKSLSAIFLLTLHSVGVLRQIEWFNEREAKGISKE